MRKTVYKMTLGGLARVELGDLYKVDDDGDIWVGEKEYLTVKTVYGYLPASKEETELYYKIHLVKKIEMYC